MTSYVKKLPAIFQTTTQSKFFDATVDQVFSKKDSSLLAGYLGRRVAGDYNAISDFYVPEPSKNRTRWQLEATAYALDASSNKTNIFFYEDLLNYINYYGGNTLNQDRLFDSEYYSFAPPIDYDMFTNYANYYWVEQGLPAITITGITAASIIGQPSYTTPITATPANLTLTTGMTIQIVGDPVYSVSHVVENMGGCTGIKLVPLSTDFTVGTAFEFLPWDSSTTLATGRSITNTNWDSNTWETQTRPSNGDYITIERGSLDRNAWSRSNKWFHIDAITASNAATNSPFPSNSTRALRPIIQFIADLILYNSGTQFKANITYGIGNNSSNKPILLADFNNQPVISINAQFGTEFAGGEVVGFFNDPTTNQNLYQAYVSAGILTFSTYLPPAVSGDIVFITKDGPYGDVLAGETWYYDNGIWQEAANDKSAVNQPPLFQLYDHNSVSLDDMSVYPGSTFTGSKIFSYSVDATPNSPVDPVLGFAILYTALGQASDILFENNIVTDRYTYGANLLNIDGYYYYRTATTPVLYNSWNLYEPQSCSTSLPGSVLNGISTSKQRVIDTFVVGYGSEFQFALSVIPYGDPSTPDIIVIVNGTEIPSVANRADGYALTEINGQLYVDLSTYITALLLSVQPQAPIVEIQSYTHGLLDPAASGYFEIPQQLEANPTQQEITTISGSNLIQQFSSIISNQLGEVGAAFGGPNNYRDTAKNRSLGTFILQNVTPVLKAMLPMSDSNLDFIAAERFSSDEYTKFKNKYVRTALQLINRGFDPVQYHNNTIVISAWVEEILNTINIANEYSNAFAYSYMIANGSPYANETDIVLTNGALQLSNYIDLTDVRNAMYVYNTTANENLLLVGEDYDIISTNALITLQLNLSSPNVSIGDSITINLYNNPLPAYIPSTPTKIGAYPVFLPRIETDYSYIIPAQVIIGHDGSKTLAYGDYRDNLLLELEKRIYNLLHPLFMDQYYLPVRLESVKPGYFRQARYTRAEFLEVTRPLLNKWSAKNKANYQSNDWASMSISPAVVPTFVPGSGNIWKLYNYTSAISASGRALNLPGNWKGIYQYYYDTVYPNTRPWEMLGFSEQPSWWETEYGTPTLDVAGQLVWTSTASGLNNMWYDLENGIIRQGPTAIYDPVTLLPQVQPMWERPGLSTIIPVDTAGELISIMSLFNIVFSGNYYEPFDHFDAAWAYGDGAPVEQAWLSSSAYTFSVQEFLYLMKPAQYGEYMWDTVGTQLSTGMITVPNIDGPVMSNTNWQFVQNDTYSSVTSDPFFSWMRPKNADQYVHAENVDSSIQVRFGYQRWISDRIMFLNMDVASTFGQKIRTLDINLANKFAGFTNKDTTKVYIEAVSPSSTTNTLAIPSTDFEVVLYTSPVVATYSYSGIIIRALANGTFSVYGYDLLNSVFTTLDRANTSAVSILVGGTPAPFVYYVQGATYNAGDIVRYNGVYYQSLVTQVAQTFISGNYRKLPALPTVGGVSVNYRPNSLTTTTTYPYGVVIDTVQEVFDLMIGYGAYLSSIGWQFENVDSTTNTVSDWLASAKQFLFWLNSSWAPDATIQLSPLANSATIIVGQGYPNDVETMSNGVYSILDKYGIAIPSNSITTDRNGTTMTVSPNTVGAGGIYYLHINTSTTEHILIFNNTTSFNDTVFDPLLLARQQRLRFNGYRTNGWYGKMEAAGYIIMNNQLVPNYDTIVDSMRYFYDPNVVLDNTSLEDLAHHLIGYESKSYLDNMQVDENIQYMFYQGSIRQKGTTQALNALFRSDIIQSNEDIVVYEEWALKLGNFGNTIEQVSTEFVLQPQQNTGQVIVARLNFVPSTVGFVREINILNAQNTYTTVPKILIGQPDAVPNVGYSAFSPNTEYVEGQVVNYPDAQGNESYYSSNVNQTPASFDSTQWTLILATRIARAYAVLNSTGQLARVDITDPGIGYLGTPTVNIISGLLVPTVDQLYAVWQGQIVTDTAINNIIDISIDDPVLWTVRPNDPEYALEFPMTDTIRYPIPNAGYVNSVDVDWLSYNVAQTTVSWGTPTLNPGNGDTIWVASTFTGDWNVYKMVEFAAPWSVTADSSNNLILLTTLGATSTLNIASTSGGANAVLVPVVNSAGSITSVNITASGIDYNVSDIITATPALPFNLTDIVATFEITSVGITGEILSVAVTNAGANTGYAPIENVTMVPQLWPVSGTYQSQFGNMISLQQVVGGVPVPSNNYSVGFQPYTTTDYNNPGTYTDPVSLITYNAYYLTTLAGTPITSTDIGNYADFTDLLLYSTLRFNTVPTTLPNYVTTGNKVWVDNGSVWDPINELWLTPDNLWSVYTYAPPVLPSIAPLTLFRQQAPLINTLLFESANVYSTVTDDQLVQLPIYDPFKNILPGPAKQNITYATLQDPARYNVTGNPSLFSQNIGFAGNQVGQLWWDLSTAAYMYYEQPVALDGSETAQDNLIYVRDNWGRLFPGSTISIYEWTQSTVPPSQYAGTGIPKDTSTYVQVTTSNMFTGATVTNYYFWVSGATTQPNLTNRTMTSTDVALMLQSPLSQGFVFFSPIQQTATNNSYMFYNVLEILAYQGNNVQIQYRQADRNDQTHTQWMFFREGDPASIVTDQYWNKMVDSLCGYTQLFPESDGYNGIIIADDLPWDIYGWDISPWDDATSITSPVYGMILAVPDPTLSAGEAYGIDYRPRQSMFISQTNALKVFTIAANALLQYIPIRDNNENWGAALPGWNASSTSADNYYGTYWTYTDWYLKGYENSTPTVVYQTLAQATAALSAGLLTTQDIVEVSNGTIDGRFVLYAVQQVSANAPLSFLEVGIQNSAILLLNSIYTTTNLYSLPVELRLLLNAFRTQVMIDEYIVDQNELFFSMINYVMSEQKNPPWVFKSSYIYISENNIPLSQPTLYTPDQIDNILDFITDSKPYHTQVRDYTSSYITTDVAVGTADDSYTWDITVQYGPTTGEVAVGTSSDNFMISVDTWLPLNQIGSTYSAFNDMWDTFDPVVNNIVTSQYGGQSMGFGNSMWDQDDISKIPSTPAVMPPVISSRENLNTTNGINFYRSSPIFEGVLLYELPVPTNSASDVLIITVTAPTDILPDPGTATSAIWIGGERIEYNLKTLVSSNKWNLSIAIRGSNHTAITDHTAGSLVWVEAGNIFTGSPNSDVWNGINMTPVGTSDITSVPLGGLWYAQTPEAIFLKQGYSPLAVVTTIIGGPASSFPVRPMNYGTSIIGGPASSFPVGPSNYGSTIVGGPASTFPVGTTVYGTVIVGGPVSTFPVKVGNPTTPAAPLPNAPISVFPVKLLNYGISVVSGPVSAFPITPSNYGTTIVGGPVSAFPVAVRSTALVPNAPISVFPVKLLNYGTTIISGPVSVFPVKLLNYGTTIISGPISVFPAQLSGIV